jgi:hypothetical protein
VRIFKKSDASTTTRRWRRGLGVLLVVAAANVAVPVIAAEVASAHTTPPSTCSPFIGDPGAATPTTVTVVAGYGCQVSHFKVHACVRLQKLGALAWATTGTPTVPPPTNHTGWINATVPPPCQVNSPHTEAKTSDTATCAPGEAAWWMAVFQGAAEDTATSGVTHGSLIVNNFSRRVFIVCPVPAYVGPF